MFPDPASSPGLHFGLTRPPLGVGQCLGSSPPKRRGHLALSVTSALIPWSKRCPRVPALPQPRFLLRARRADSAELLRGRAHTVDGVRFLCRRRRERSVPRWPPRAISSPFFFLHAPAFCCRRRFVLPRSLALSCLFTFCHYGLAAETLFDLNSKKTTSTKHLPRKKTHNPPDTSQSTDIFQMLVDP